MEDPQADPERSDSDQYREVASKLRELARRYSFPRAREDLIELALRYERRADQLPEPPDNINLRCGS
jgi:hypothetical protein